MPMVKVLLDEKERDALVVLSRRERRDPRAQAALCIRRELERRGLLLPPDQYAHAEGQAQAVRCD